MLPGLFGTCRLLFAKSGTDFSKANLGAKLVSFSNRMEDIKPNGFYERNFFAQSHCTHRKQICIRLSYWRGSYTILKICHPFQTKHFMSFISIQIRALQRLFMLLTSFRRIAIPIYDILVSCFLLYGLIYVLFLFFVHVGCFA